MIQQATGLPAERFERKRLLEGAKEIDIVYAGLEEIMSAATDEVIETALNKQIDLRTAAFMNAINKMHEYYQITGFSNW